MLTVNIFVKFWIELPTLGYQGPFPLLAAFNTGKFSCKKACLGEVMPVLGQMVDCQKVDSQKADGQKVDGQKVDSQMVDCQKGD